MTRCTKKKESVPHSKERKKSEAIPDVLMAVLLDRDFKTIMLKVLKELKGDVEKIKKVMYVQNGNICKELKNFKRNQVEILEFKSTSIEMKGSVE